MQGGTMNFRTFLTHRKHFYALNRIIERPYSIKSLWEGFKVKYGFKPPPGKLVGEDHFGNRYYEREPYKRDRIQKNKRWLETERSKDLSPYLEDYHQDLDIPSEWRAWLQYKRNSPPTETEIKKNLKVSMRTKIRAVEYEEKEAKEREEMGLEKIDPYKHSNAEFPIYPEFETKPKFKEDIKYEGRPAFPREQNVKKIEDK